MEVIFTRKDLAKGTVALNVSCLQCFKTSWGTARQSCFSALQHAATFERFTNKKIHWSCDVHCKLELRGYSLTWACVTILMMVPGASEGACPQQLPHHRHRSPADIHHANWCRFFSTGKESVSNVITTHTCIKTASQPTCQPSQPRHTCRRECCEWQLLPSCFLLAETTSVSPTQTSNCLHK